MHKLCKAPWIKALYKCTIYIQNKQRSALTGSPLSPKSPLSPAPPLRPLGPQKERWGEKENTNMIEYSVRRGNKVGFLTIVQDTTHSSARVSSLSRGSSHSSFALPESSRCQLKHTVTCINPTLALRIFRGYRLIDDCREVSSEITVYTVQSVQTVGGKQRMSIAKSVNIAPRLFSCLQYTMSFHLGLDSTQ